MRACTVPAGGEISSSAMRRETRHVAQRFMPSNAICRAQLKREADFGNKSEGEVVADIEGTFTAG